MPRNRLEDALDEAEAARAMHLEPIPGKVSRLSGAGWYTDSRGRQVRVNAYGQRVKVVEVPPDREQKPDPYLFESGGLSQTQKNARAEADAAAAAYQQELSQTAAAHAEYGRAHAPAGTSGSLRRAVHAMLAGGDPLDVDPLNDGRE